MNISDFDLFNLLLPFLFGCTGFFVCLLGQRLVKGAVVKEQHRHANDKLLSMIHALVRSKNETVLIEVEIQEALETLPIDRARWLVEMRQIAASVPPMVLEQVRRFGLYEPPPDLAAPTITMPAPPDPPPGIEVPPSRPRLVTNNNVFVEPPPAEEIPVISAWGGRVASG